MPRVITIDPGKSKCGLVLAEISEKKVYKAIILKSELLENYVRNLISSEDISQIIIGNGTTSRETIKKLYFFKKEIITFEEKNTTYRAKARYFELFPINSLLRIIALLTFFSLISAKTKPHLLFPGSIAITLGI